jgi:hypothetical protein
MRRIGHGVSLHPGLSPGWSQRIAFSSEVDTGSREENASKQKSGASVQIQSAPIMLQSITEKGGYPP